MVQIVVLQVMKVFGHVGKYYLDLSLCPEYVDIKFHRKAD
jgi:hypothetical protein